METTYKLRKHDGHVYVSIQPLMRDIEKIISDIQKINTDNLSDSDKQELQLKKIGLEAIYTFMGGLVMEYQLKQLQKEMRDKNDIASIH